MEACLCLEKMKLSSVLLIVKYLIWEELQNIVRDCVLAMDIQKGYRCIVPVSVDEVILCSLSAHVVCAFCHTDTSL